MGIDAIALSMTIQGFIPNYWIWTLHGEDMSAIDLHEGDNYVPRDGVRTVEMEQLCDMEEMVNNALCQFQSTQQPNDTNLEECPNESTQRFYNLLAEANQPLFEGAKDSKLSACVRLLSLVQEGALAAIVFNILHRFPNRSILGRGQKSIAFGLG